MAFYEGINDKTSSFRDAMWLLKQKSVYKELFIRYLGKPAYEDFKNVYLPCPFCDNAVDNFCVSKTENHFRCLDCKASGSSIEFIIRMQLLVSRYTDDIYTWLFLLLNYYPENIKTDEKNLLETKSIRFNVALFIDYKFFSKDNKPIFISEDDVEKIKINLKELGFSNSKIKHLNVDRMKDRYVFVLSHQLFVDDFIAYNKDQGIVYSVLYKNYKPEKLLELKKQIKELI